MSAFEKPERRSNANIVTKNLFAGDVVKGVISVLLMKIPRIA